MDEALKIPPIFKSFLGDGHAHDAETQAALSKREMLPFVMVHWHEALESIMNKLKPEAAYFGALDGKRGGMVFFNLSDPSQIVEVCRTQLFLESERRD